MPLDTGLIDDLRVARGAGGARSWITRAQQVSTAADVGAGLRRVRETLGLSLQDIAATTRVRVAYIAAIEALDTTALPPRPFSIGYVRAYAQALGLETEAIARRFKAEAPEAIEPHAPSSAGRARSGRRLPLVALAVAVALAVVGWNLTRHGAGAGSEQSLTPSSRLLAANAQPAAGSIRLGAPLPAPPEAATPPVYQTPGLAAALAGDGASGAVKSPPSTAPSPLSVVTGPAGARFVATGPIYSIGGPASDVILRARAPASLVVRGAAGAVYFARQLAAGEAWRAPAASGLVADVDNPAAVEVFVGGVSRGMLTATKTPLASLSD
jgi:transcriptional regulator with XRE-family HTH domain